MTMAAAGSVGGRDIGAMDKLYYFSKPKARSTGSKPFSSSSDSAPSFGTAADVARRFDAEIWWRKRRGDSLDWQLREGSGDQSMNNTFSGSPETLLDHQSKDDNDKAEPEVGRDGHVQVPSSEAGGGNCSSKGTSDSKKRRRPNEVQSSNLPTDSANESVHNKDKDEESSAATTTVEKGEDQ